MTKSLLFTLGLLISFCSFSQEKIDVGVNFNFAYPTSDFGFGSEDSPLYLPPGTAFGGSLEGNYWFTNYFSAGLEASYLMFADDIEPINGVPITTSATAIPIMAKATVYLGRGIVKPYLELGAGYSIYTQKQSYSDISVDPAPIEVVWDQSGAIVSPRLGLKVDFTDQLSMKINVQYNQMINKVDGDKSVDITLGGETTAETLPALYANSVGYLGVNVGVTYALFNHFGRF
jgi:hypothetical protein